ncbi:hypothetical protein J6590_032313 [Homalodisca vitripennis]|nr:hypothetical protein J6590_032313 [Homalodisca vitripennis]
MPAVHAIAPNKAKNPSLTLNLGTNGLKVTSEPPPMAGQAGRLQGQDRSAVTYTSSGHARHTYADLEYTEKKTSVSNQKKCVCLLSDRACFGCTLGNQEASKNHLAPTITGRPAAKAVCQRITRD